MLELRNITFAPDGKNAVLRGVNLEVRPGEKVALVAPSGAGKTTLCRIAAGYARPDAGEVLVDGAPLPRKGRCPVQLIGQHPEHFLDPRLTISASLAEARVKGTGQMTHSPVDGPGQMACRGRLQQRNMPSAPSPGMGSSNRGDESFGLSLCLMGVREEWLGRYPRELSGGELQRICIARALLAQPRYLVCDEITTSLDAVTQARIWEAVLDEATRANMGLLIVTHSPALTARLADRVVRLQDANARKTDQPYVNERKDPFSFVNDPTEAAK